MNERKSIILRDVHLRENALTKNVYLWMILGLAITAGVSYLSATSVAIINFVYSKPLVTIAIFIAQIVLVMVLSSRVERLSTGAAIGIFIGYSALTGLTLSSVFLAYTRTSIAIAFVSALSVFVGGALYGAITKKDLRSMGGYLTMGLFGLIITAWDAQRIAAMNQAYGSEMTNEELTKIGILGALDLYLDFINIFLYLVRIVGRSDN